MQLKPGIKLGPYEIIDLLGSGGMGEVYRAHDPRLVREVAVKVLPQQFTGNAERMRRFEQEARAAGMLNHPNILTIYDIGSANESVYVVSELLTGKTLREKMKESAIPSRKVVDYSLQIARGLSAAHDKGIVHRDLKPENIFITQDGRIKLLDFGLAKLTSPEPVGSQQSALLTVDPGTEPGVVLGTMGYMSPEQVRGKSVDHRSDIFSLGAILYEMISGNRAFAGDSSADVITAILKSDPPELPVTGAPIPPGMQRVIQHCLEKDPEERFQSVRDLAFDLEMISGISGASSSTATAAAIEPPPRKKSLHLSVILPLGLAIVFAAGLLFGKYFLASNNSTAPAGAPQAIFQKLTDVPGEEYEPSLSPDGKTFVYVSRPSGKSDIFLSRVGGRNATNLTQRSTANDSQPAFSPSGDQIAFRSDRDGGGIFVMGASGESVRRLTDFGYFPSWSTDGKEIIFSTVNNDALHAAGNTEVWTVNVENGQKKKLLDGRDFSAPRWNHKGNRIAFWGLVADSGQRDIWMSDPSGKNIVAVTDDSFIDWNPVWSPDGEYLYFISDRSGSMNIARVPIDQKSGKVLGSPENIITPSVWIENLSFSSNPKQLVYAAFDRRSEIRKFSFDPVQEKLGAQSEEISSSTDFYDQLQVSPDGEWLTFFTVWPQQDIFVIKTDGSEKTRLTDDRYRNRYPSWSADGKSVAFMSDRSGRYDFWTIQRDGSNLTQATRGTQVLWQQQYSPDGKSVSAVNESGTDIYDATALPWSDAGKLPKLVPNDEHPFMAHCWSHDGKSIAGTRYTFGGELIIYSLERRNYKIIPVPADLTLGGFSIAGWLPDDQRVLLTSAKTILIADTQTGEVRKVSEFDAEIFFAKLSLDARTLYVQRTSSQSDIWMATLQ